MAMNFPITNRFFFIIHIPSKLNTSNPFLKYLFYPRFILAVVLCDLKLKVQIKKYASVMYAIRIVRNNRKSDVTPENLIRVTDNEWRRVDVK